MNHLNVSKTALVFAAFFGGWHVIWSILVFLGWGQPLVDFVLWAHMIQLPYFVDPFDATASATLIVVTAIVGYVFGWIFATLWNHFHRA